MVDRNDDSNVDLYRSDATREFESADLFRGKGDVRSRRKDGAYILRNTRSNKFILLKWRCVNRNANKR